MRRAHLARGPLLAFLGGLLALIALALAISDRGGDEAPASSAVLDRIAVKNREAATASAARLRADSDAAADARRAAEADLDLAQPSR